MSAWFGRGFWMADDDGHAPPRVLGLLRPETEARMIMLQKMHAAELNQKASQPKTPREVRPEDPW